MNLYWVISQLSYYNEILHTHYTEVAGLLNKLWRGVRGDNLYSWGKKVFIKLITAAPTYSYNMRSPTDTRVHD